MFCTNCNSPYAAPYQSLAGAVGSAISHPTTLPCPTPASVETALATTTTPSQPSFLATPSGLVYKNVNNLPTQTIYGDQGANANIVCGQRPMNSVMAQPMWNTQVPCVPTETKVAENVANYDVYTSNLSVFNPLTHRPLPTLVALLSPQNIEFVKGSIECMLSKSFGFDIGIEDTPAFRQTFNDVAVDNPGMMYDVQNALPLLNQVIINREFTVHQSAIRQQLLYEKYMIRNDRQKFMPYAQGDRTVKGETVNDPSSYTLNRKTPVSYDCFLTQANLWCKK